jgi:hypothetical protein
MASRVKNHRRHPRRQPNRLLRTVGSHWAVAHTTAALVIVLLEHLHQLASCGGR